VPKKGEQDPVPHPFQALPDLLGGLDALVILRENVFGAPAQLSEVAPIQEDHEHQKEGRDKDHQKDLVPDGESNIHGIYSRLLGTKRP